MPEPGWCVLGSRRIEMAVRKRRFYIVFAILLSGCSSHDSLAGGTTAREELLRLQRESGLSLADYYGGISIVSFISKSVVRGEQLLPDVREGRAVGAISRDGKRIALQVILDNEFYLGIIGTDGTKFQEYPKIRSPLQMCWADDNTKLALVLEDTPPDTRLVVMNVDSGAILDIDPRAKVTSQCLSPDVKRITYEADNSIRLYELGADKSTTLVLAKGQQPTWSADGQWIAFLDAGTYYAIHPSGEGRKVLFHRSGAASGLFWSPDSRLVAYVSRAGIFDGVLPPLDAELYQLRVRRLSDDSDDRVAIGVAAGASYQWVKSKDLVDRFKLTAVPN